MKQMFAITILATLAASLIACNITPVAISPGETLMRSAKRVPLAIGEAVSLGTQGRAMGTLSLQNAVDTKFLALTAKDPLGNDALHLVFTLPNPSQTWQDALPYADEKGTTTLVGATVAHNIIAGAQDNLMLIAQIGAAAELLGGSANFAGLIATTNSFEGLYAASKDGRWASLSTPPEAISAEAQKAMLVGFRASADALVASKVAEQLEQNWQEILEPKSEDGKAQLEQLASGAHFDLRGAARILNAQAGARPQRRTMPGTVGALGESQTSVNCWWFMWWQICTDQITAEPKAVNFMRSTGNTEVTSEGFGGGFNQRYSSYGGATDENYSIGGVLDAGCGPSAFASLLNYHWLNGVNFDGKPAFANTEHILSYSRYSQRQVQQSYKAQVNRDSTIRSPVMDFMARQADGWPRFTAMARSFPFNDGTLATPWNLEAAFATYLAQQRSQGHTNATLTSAYTLSPIGYGVLQVADDTFRANGLPVAIGSLVAALPWAIAQAPFSYVYNLFRQPVFGDIIRRHVGQRGEMVIALYPTGNGWGWEAHYSAILSAKIIYHAVRPEILIEPLDKFNGRDWYSISDPLASFAGVFALEK